MTRSLTLTPAERYEVAQVVGDGQRESRIRSQLRAAGLDPDQPMLVEQKADGSITFTQTAPDRRAA